MLHDRRTTRRDCVKLLASATGTAVLASVGSACSTSGTPPPVSSPDPTPKPADEGVREVEAADPLVLPKSRPASWDPIAFNKARGNAGAIPSGYRDDINGPDGDTKHLGKHLPYVPAIDGAIVPADMVPLMWGDPSKGYARHPNASPSKDNPEGHWYDWIRIRKAVEGDAQEVESHYRGWPEIAQPEDGAYAVMGGGDIAGDAGKNTIYLAKLPPDVGPGDTVRIHAHCLTHGEYVDFLTV